MIRKNIVAIGLAVSLAALATALLARPSGAAHRRFTFAYVTNDTGKERGSRAAARRLGIRYILLDPNKGGPQGQIKRYRSLIASHADAIAPEGYDPALEPIFREIRKAGILLVSSGDDIAAKRDLWVGPSDPGDHARALGDAIASQIDKKGEYAILEEPVCRPNVPRSCEFPSAHTLAKTVAASIRKAYPEMKLDGMLTETGGGGQTNVDSVKSFMAAHPNLKGLIGIDPTEAYMAAEAITQAGRIGQVFSAGNFGDSLGDPQVVGYVRSGAAEEVIAGDPRKIGYLTVWGANYLLTGHHFRPGAYQVGGPIGLVWYYAKHQELRLGQPLTITKKNVDQYAHKS